MPVYFKPTIQRTPTSCCDFQRVKSLSRVFFFFYSSCECFHHSCVRPKATFLHQLLSQLTSLPESDYERLIVVGDFNLDQKSPEHRNCFTSLIDHFHFIQRSTYSTHKYGGILDLIFDNDESKNPAEWMPSPFSDHFIMMFDL